ncbi:short chain dehydrogenase domain-containing protein [Trichoderma breve]|uniref:Short chain dehydrogenase domain-containing protein n=1 Tax=Trichoderma breve TaxID=2034170 RepID=A0A9W9B6S3_9HYPO|nr:short chain dehydrogenase domain-containing protein [Trichoderma breve]KAJ4854548.1 short chain dehydrogenase domain-containing protein [Trichoderma breve]
MSSNIILITGGNTGLGLEIARALCQSSKSYKILLAGRSLEKATAATEKLASKQLNGSTTVEPIQLDVEDDESINSAFKFVEEQFGRLDVLVNNAGANFDRELYLGKVSLREAWNKSWAVNTVGSHVVSSVFTPLLLKSADPRLIFIASGTATLHGQTKEERSAKTGMNMMMREWARVLKEDKVKVCAVSPGLLATGLGGDQELLRQMGAIDPQIGAELVTSVIEGERDTDMGLVINMAGVQPW